MKDHNGKTQFETMKSAPIKKATKPNQSKTLQVVQNKVGDESPILVQKNKNFLFS